MQLAQDATQENESMTQLQQYLAKLYATSFGGTQVRDQDGQTLAEYALILALIAAVVAVAVIFLQGQISSIFSSIGSQI
jgi:Flp pilus assembly pilin Flp